VNFWLLSYTQGIDATTTLSCPNIENTSRIMVIKPSTNDLTQKVKSKCGNTSKTQKQKTKNKAI
jgi:hypothetical protein